MILSSLFCYLTACIIILSSSSNSFNPLFNSIQVNKNSYSTNMSNRGKGKGNAGGWPSTTGNPSGGGRSNSPAGGSGRGQSRPSGTGNPSGGGRSNNPAGGSQGNTNTGGGGGSTGGAGNTGNTGAKK